MKIRKSNIFLAVMLGIISQMTLAATTVNFKGNLIIPDCTINNSNPLEVDFGDIEIQTLSVTNTAYHGRDFSIPMTCPYILGTPKLTMTSSAVHNALQGIIQTSKYSEGLVIYLRQKGGGTAVPLSTATNISSSVTGTGTSKTLTLNAGVGRYKDMTLLTPGPFTASASLQVRYE
ncbi:fimbrial protein [Salmonella enterica]|nr:fimbrial protein [Salmonella enterica subsp. enterica serovar Oslo]EHW8352257.1 fimbrial protein [Salmonella enterica]EHW8353109.1 fimbrial protein [Salmonella enterica]